MRLFLLSSLFLSFWQSSLIAQASFVVNSADFKKHKFTTQVDGYVDPSDDSWDGLDLAPSAEKFRPATEVDFTQAVKGAGWLRTSIQNQSPDPLNLILYTDMALYPLHFYEARGNRLRLLSAVSEKLTVPQADTFTGTGQLPLLIQPGESREIYLKFQRRLPAPSINLFLASRETFEAFASRDIGLRHLFLGITLVILCSNLFFWIKLGRSEYLIYALYLSSYAAAISVAFFLLLSWLPDIWLRKYFWELKSVFYDLSIVLASYFTTHFLKLDKRLPWCHRIFVGVSALFIANIPLSFYSLVLNDQIRSWASLVFGPLLFTASVLVARQKYRPAIYFSLGWGILVFANAVSVVYEMGFLHYSYFYDWIIPLGASAEMLILSFGLSDSFQIQQQTARMRIEELHKALQTSKDQLQTSYDDLQRSEAFRTQFFHNTSHELRTPLNGILGYLAMCLRGQHGQISRELQASLAKAHRLADSLKHQIDAILNLAKLKRNDVQVHGSDIALPELLEQAQHLAEGLCLGQKNTSFQAELLVDSPEQDHFVCDLDMLSTILRNLLGNAIKFSDPMRANHVQLKLHRQRHCLRIEVRDRGIGIPLEHRQAIFQEFHQVIGEERRRYEGTGIGLSLVQQYVSLLDGQLELESRVGEGTCFVIQVPELNAVEMSRDPEIDEPFSFAQAAEDTAEVDLQVTETLKGIKVLIVDDHLANCEILEALLEYQGAEARFTQSGREALLLMDKQSPDIVLLDMMMPEFSGEDVLEAIHANTRLSHIPVIVITARAGEEDRLRTFKIGADDYLAKPIIEQELLLRIKNILNRKQLTQHIARLESQQKLTLLGSSIQSMEQKLRAFTGKSDESQAILEDFVRELLGLTLQIPLWHQSLRDGIGFDLSVCMTPEHKKLSGIPNISAELRLMAYYLKGFDLSEEQRDKLWQELFTCDPIRLQALAASFQNLARHLELNEHSLATRRLLQAALTLCRDDQADKACELSGVVEQALCLLEQRAEAKDFLFETQLQKCEWILPASALLQILVRLGLFCLKTFGTAEQGACLLFETHEEGQVRHLTLTLRGLRRERYSLEQILAQIQSPDAPSEQRIEWQELLALISPYALQCHWNFPSQGPECCLTMRATAHEASALLVS